MSLPGTHIHPTVPDHIVVHISLCVLVRFEFRNGNWGLRSKPRQRRGPDLQQANRARG